MSYKSCIVPKCKNTTFTAPDKLYFTVPMEPKLRKKWFRVMKKPPIGPKSTCFCCEDHFDVEKDMENYLKYRMMGGRIPLKRGVVPHKFACQGRKSPVLERSAYKKRRMIEYYERVLNPEICHEKLVAEEVFVSCEDIEPTDSNTNDEEAENPIEEDNLNLSTRSTDKKAIFVVTGKEKDGSKVMKQFEYEPERLIEEVKKRPAIWNLNDPNHKSMAARYEQWNELVHELLQPDAKVTKSELRELVLQLQKKWKSLKDAFSKYVQNPFKSKRPYIYHKQLQFLIHKKEPIVSDLSFGDEQSEAEETQLKKSKLKTVQVTESSSDEECHVVEEEYLELDGLDHTGNSNDSGPSSAKKSKIEKPEIAFANVDTFSKNDGDDCDKYFLLSLLPDLRSIPEEYRLDAKMEVLEVLKKYSKMKPSF